MGPKTKTKIQIETEKSNTVWQARGLNPVRAANLEERT
nr:MAG TPA: hypothetical protein [Caudoviricetes sp.]